MKLENNDNAIDEFETLLIKETKRDQKSKQMSAAKAEILRSHLTYNKKQQALHALCIAAKERRPDGQRSN